MTDSDEFPDDVPIADAIEQRLPAIDSDDEFDNEEGPGADPVPAGEVPMEANPPDWQEQQQTVPGIDDELDDQ
jgi:hypothetical protein